MLSQANDAAAEHAAEHSAPKAISDLLTDIDSANEEDEADVEGHGGHDKASRAFDILRRIDACSNSGFQSSSPR